MAVSADRSTVLRDAGRRGGRIAGDRRTEAARRSLTKGWTLDPISGCHLWSGSTDKDGYGFVGLEGRWERAHRVAYKILVGPIPAGSYVCHRCDTPRCVNIEHLFLGTATENYADMVAKGRERKRHGENHPSARLNETAVRAIRLDRRTLREIASEYGVGQMAIHNVLKRKTWKHVR